MPKKDQNNLDTFCAQLQANQDEIEHKKPVTLLQKIRDYYPVWKHPNAYRGGTPTKCTESTVTIICEILADGNYIDTAVAAVGINQDTYYHWLKLAERDADRKKYPGWGNAPDESPYMAFSDAVKQARAIAEIGLMREIRHDRDNKTFAPLAWILERTRQERFGQRQQIDVTHTVTAGIESVPSPPSSIDEFISRAKLQAQAANDIQAQAVDAEYAETTENSTKLLDDHAESHTE